MQPPDADGTLGTQDNKFRVFPYGSRLKRFAAPPSCTNPANAARGGPGATIEHKLLVTQAFSASIAEFIGYEGEPPQGVKAMVLHRRSQ